MGDDHQHISRGMRAGALWIALALDAGHMVVELVGGLAIAGSVSLTARLSWSVIPVPRSPNR